MRCGKAQRWISVRLDGELDAKRQRALVSHLAACKRCRTFAAEFDATAERLQTVPAADPQWGFADRVRARLGNLEPGATPAVSGVADWLRLLRPAPIGVGAAAFCAGVALVVLANGEVDTQQAAAGDMVAVLADEYLGIEAQPRLEDELVSLLPESEE